MIRGWESREGLPLGAEEAGMGRITGGLESPQEGPEAVLEGCSGTGQSGLADDVTGLPGLC